jgi:hypothetical protein
MGRIEDIDGKIAGRIRDIDDRVGRAMRGIDEKIGGPCGDRTSPGPGAGAWGGSARSPGGAAERAEAFGSDVGRGAVRRMGLCVGLNEVSPAAYGNWVAPLAGCVADAERFLCVLKKLGFAAQKLLDAAASCANVFSAIAEAAKALRDGDLFVCHVSGHGGQAPGPRGACENWCLYDGEAWDGDIVWAFSRFRPGVRILVVNDQCHSGGVFQSRAAGADSPFGRLCAKAGRPAGWDAASALRSPGYPRLIQFAACRAEQTSIDALGGGTWTQALVNALDEAFAEASLPTYRQWFDRAFASPTLRRGRQDPQWVESASVTDGFRNATALQ